MQILENQTHIKPKQKNNMLNLLALTITFAAMFHITIINGPNLNLLGNREVNIYGNQSFDEYLLTLKKQFLEFEIHYFQSNIEGELINAVQQANAKSQAIIINAAGYTHTSVALGDAVAALSIPCVEVHISQILKREPFRHHSYIAPNATGMITGFGLHGYFMALQYLEHYFKAKK
jgi:3-dehydroquinate dehydratase-2